MLKFIFKKSYFLVILTLLVINQGCKKAEESEAPSISQVGGNITNSNVKKVAPRQLELKFDSTILQKYSKELITQLINEVFTNEGKYFLVRTDNIPSINYKIDSVNFVERTQYLINTRDIIRPGVYEIKLINDQDVIINETFSVTINDAFGVEDDEGGNYSAFTPVVKEFENGVILSVIDAEIGMPSFYALKTCLPEANNQKVELKNDLQKSRDIDGNHKLYIGNKDPIEIRDAFITGFDPKEDGADFDADRKPTREYYAEEINNKQYSCIETLVYLNKMPELDQIYKISINPQSTNIGVMESPAFKFRFAFSKVNLRAYTNLRAKNICFVTEQSGLLKCIGDNTYLSTGYDVGRYNPTPPYKLDYIKGIRNTRDVAINRFTTCAIFEADEAKQTSKTKCWGSNNKGLLGTGNKKTASFGSADEYYAENTTDNFFYTFPENATEIADTVFGYKPKLQNIYSAVNDFCAVSFSKQLFCWGPLTGSIAQNALFVTGIPSLVEYHAVSDVQKALIEEIESFALGNTPNYCFIGTIENSSRGLYCLGYDIQLDSSTQNNKVHYTAPGEGFQCSLYVNAQEEFFNNNIGCTGTNANNAKGIDDSNDPGPNTVVYPNLGADEIATKLFAGQKFFCYINQNSQAKCSSINPNLPEKADFFGNLDNDKSIMADRKFLKFYDGVKVIDGQAGENIICLTLEREVYSEKYYAVKCWGEFTITDILYYNSIYDSTTTASSWNLFDYVPVIRW